MKIKSKVRDVAVFGSNFLKNPLKNASLVPSSAASSRAIVKNIDFSRADTIVELGPGTGVFTKEIVKRAKPESKIILVEIEKSYVKILRDKFGARVTIENTSALRLDEILSRHGIKKVDLIISGLPFLQGGKGRGLMQALKKHTDQGTIFRFFTYMPPIMKLAYKGMPIRKILFVPKNFPPLWVYGIN